MTFLRQQEISRISSRGKGPVHNTGGGGGGGCSSRSSSFRCISSLAESAAAAGRSRTTSTTNEGLCEERLAGLGGHCPTPRARTRVSAGLPRRYFLASRSRAQAACMIIDDRVAQLQSSRSARQKTSSSRSKQQRSELAAGRRLSRQLLPTSRFHSSNSHRKLQPFRET
ncbi:uncharacterized protein LOC131671441 isoform X2 [Phymastichus coffea]|uniref:uncharacterized protein LOC131671441 isoform X2 n=1 Tax=Phymastichus coffea TaxID=108790 RepID=UPI00273B6253|nr:uncharacterized protein LOC131671441 isoform X2 [Phymastichus coffea]